jgi:integrase
MIEFLAQTGCRISEMIGAEVGRSRRKPRVTRITVIGKGGKQRDLRCRTDLFDRIRTEFQGQRWIIEHSGRQYNPKSVSNRIKQLGERTIGKPVTAHMLRHYRGTDLSEKLGISKPSSELGHADIRTTKRFYDHSVVSDDEFLSSLEDYES